MGSSGATVAIPAADFGSPVAAGYFTTPSADGTAATVPHSDHVHGVTPIGGSVDVLAGMVTQGLRGASSNPAFNIGTGALTAGATALGGQLTVTAGNIQIDSSGRFGFGGSAPLAAMLSRGGGTAAHPGNATQLYGSSMNPTFPSTTTGFAYLYYGQMRTAAAAFTLAAGAAFYAEAPTIGAASAITTQVGFQSVNQGASGVTNAYGLNLAATSGAATLNVGARVDSGTTCALWLGGDTTGTTVAGGIAMGSGRDVTFFRSAANAATISATSGLTLDGGLTLSGGASVISAPFINASSSLQVVGNTAINSSRQVFAASIREASVGGTVLSFSNSSPHIAIGDAKNISFGTTTGSQLGTATTEKWAAHGATPVIQRAGAAQAAVVTTGASLASFGYTQAQADSIVTLLNEIRATLVEKGIMKGAA